jgi:tetratricopeptide (TPR) repeat protein
VAAARAAIDQGRAEIAERALADCLVAEPESKEAHRYLGRALAMQQKFDEAAGHYHAGQPLDEDAVLELGTLYDVTERYAAAAQVYREALQRFPESAPLHQQHGLTQAALKDWAAATTALAEAVRLRPGDAEILLDLAFVWAEQGDAGQAGRLISEVLAATPDHSQAISMATRVFDAPALSAALDKAVAHHDAAELRWLRGQSYRGQGAWSRAREDFRAGLALRPDDAPMALSVAAMAVQLGDLVDAERHVARAHAIVGDAAPVRFRRAQVAWRRGDHKAILELEMYAEAHPDAREAWEELVAAATAQGHAPLLRKARMRLQEMGELGRPR